MSTRPLFASTLVVLLASAAALTGCSDKSASSDGSEGTTLTVLAASSLTDAFPEIGEAFVEEHDGVQVQYSFAGSQELVAQADSGAPADVLALAGASSLEALELPVTDAVDFAKNRLTIIVPEGNPAHVTEIEDLANPDVKVALAGPEVPAGAYTLEAFKSAGITVDPVSQETDVKAVVTRVSVGGADAGVVYVTDVKASDADIEEIPIPAAVNVIATYPAVSIADSSNAQLADEFIRFLLTNEAQTILQSH
ncbi:MAG TPA: molybdate ABC transporter substrate-binding protein, partial [Actinomycetes bacterium]|nr:molybdate ABC transporter substrate-binding protein [Actinomycetes bacterium]